MFSFVWSVVVVVVVVMVVVVVVVVVAFQLLEYQMIWWVCRFDTLGKLVSAHRAGVNTTHGWCVTPTRCVRLAAAAPPPHTGWG